MKNYIPSLTFLLLILFLNFSCKSNTEKEDKNSEDVKKEVSDDTKLKEAASSKDDLATTSTDEQKKQSPKVYGIDISKFQGDKIEFMDKKKDSLSFIICKATEGITYTDPGFDNNWKTIAEKGFIRGAYHFFRSNDEPNLQANHFINSINKLNETDLAPIVDFESRGIDKSQSVETVQTSLLQFLKSVQKKSNRKPIIYTELSSGNKYLDDPRFSNYALWIANYNSLENPDIPVAWKDKGWVFWQKTSSYKNDQTKNNFDVFNGDSGDLSKFIKTY